MVTDFKQSNLTSILQIDRVNQVNIYKLKYMNKNLYKYKIMYRRKIIALTRNISMKIHTPAQNQKVPDVINMPEYISQENDSMALDTLKRLTNTEEKINIEFDMTSPFNDRED